jgi:hypothetical protein
LAPQGPDGIDRGVKDVTRAALDDRTLANLVARHLDSDPRSLQLHRCSTGKFNTTYFVEGGPAPLVLRVAPPDDRDRMLL